MGENVVPKKYETENEKVKHAKAHAEFMDGHLGRALQLCFGTDCEKTGKKVPEIKRNIPPTGNAQLGRTGMPAKRRRSGESVSYEHVGVVQEIRKRFTETAQPNDALECQLCQHGITNVTGINIKSHVFGHLQPRPFKCVRCESASALPGNLRQHVKNRHPDVSAEGNEYFVDRRQELDSEIVTMARECYGID